MWKTKTIFPLSTRRLNPRGKSAVGLLLYNDVSAVLFYYFSSEIYPGPRVDSALVVMKGNEFLQQPICVSTNTFSPV